MKLLLDEMYSITIAEQLRARSHDVISVLDYIASGLRGAPDEEVYACAVAEQRALVTENVADFRRLEDAALAGGRAHPGLIYTTNRQFPRGDPATLGRLVVALDRLLAEESYIPGSVFLKP